MKSRKKVARLLKKERGRKGTLLHWM